MNLALKVLFILFIKKNVIEFYHNKNNNYKFYKINKKSYFPYFLNL